MSIYNFFEDFHNNNKFEKIHMCISTFLSYNTIIIVCGKLKVIHIYLSTYPQTYPTFVHSQCLSTI